MVQLIEVPDEHFEEQAALNAEENDDDFTDTDSEISTDSDFDPLNESFSDRLYALRDIVPPQTRAYIGGKASAVSSGVKSVLSLGGKTLWVVTSSALLIVVPWALAYAEDQQMAAMEQEMKMREMGGELLTAGSGQEGDTAQQVRAALGGSEVKASL